MRTQVVFARTPGWAAIVAQGSQLIDDPGFRPLKRSHRTIAGFSTLNGDTVFVKYVTEGGLLKGWVRRMWACSRVRRVLRGAEMLKVSGFARPEPLAAAEMRLIGSVRASCVISEAVDSARVMSQVVLEGGRRRFHHRREVLAAVAREIRRLHDAGVYTLDLQETNLLITGGPGEWKIHFVDLEDFRRARTVPTRRRLLNLVHLDRTIGRFLPRTQRLRFLYTYLGEHPRHDYALLLLQQYLGLRGRAGRRAHNGERPLPAPTPFRVSC